MAAESSALAGATKAAAYGVALQAFIRVSSFTLNAFVLRRIQGDVLGVVNIRLTLLYNTLLFVSREALRRACLTRTKTSVVWSKTFNLMWCSVLVWTVSAPVLCALWLSPLLTQPDLNWDSLGVVIFSISALCEISVEPLWVLAESLHHTRLKVVGEGIGQLSRVVVVVCGILLAPEADLIIFCAGQVVYSLMYVLVYLVYFKYLFTKRQVRELPVASFGGVLPSLSYKEFCDEEQFRLAKGFFWQSVLKMILTNGEGYVMTVFSVLSFAQQGVFDIISNLGSIVARFVFKPIEESFYVFFACTLYRGLPASEQKEDSLEVATKTLAVLSKFVVCIGLVILIFGLSYSHLALTIYGGCRLTDMGGHDLMRWYSLYVVLLAINGITECFFFAVMSEREVSRYNQRLLLFSATFLIFSLILTSVMGSAGFIVANCVNMLVRIVHSCRFIHRYFLGTKYNIWRMSILSPHLLVVFALVGAVLQMSEIWLYTNELHGAVAHVSVGICCLAILSLAVAKTEQDLCNFLIERLPSKLSTLLSNILKWL